MRCGALLWVSNEVGCGSLLIRSVLAEVLPFATGLAISCQANAACFEFVANAQRQIADIQLVGGAAIHNRREVHLADIFTLSLF